MHNKYDSDQLILPTKVKSGQGDTMSANGINVLHRSRKLWSLLVIDLQAEEAKVKILEVAGDRVDNKSKLEVIKQEEQIIQQEKLELAKVKVQKGQEAAEEATRLKAKMADETLVNALSFLFR